MLIRQRVEQVTLDLVHIKGRTQTEGVWEQGAEENIWTYERGSGGRLEKTA
jgi:hypothetical protein